MTFVQGEVTFEEINITKWFHKSNYNNVLFIHPKFKNAVIFISKKFHPGKKKQEMINQLLLVVQRYQADSNRCRRFCRPLPDHSAIVPLRVQK